MAPAAKAARPAADAERDIGHHGAEDVRHRHCGRGHALHGHQQQAVRRQQQPELHADQIQHAEPDEVDVEPLHDRHEHRQRDQHHADLVDEDAEEDEQRIMPIRMAKGDRPCRNTVRHDGPSVGARKAQDLREGWWRRG
jgi:hypothetical protein